MFKLSNTLQISKGLIAKQGRKDAVQGDKMAAQYPYLALSATVMISVTGRAMTIVVLISGLTVKESQDRRRRLELVTSKVDTTSTEKNSKSTARNVNVKTSVDAWMSYVRRKNVS